MNCLNCRNLIATCILFLFLIVLTGCPDLTDPPIGNTERLPQKPEKLEAYFFKANGVRLVWEDLSDNETAFTIFESVGNDTSFKATVPVGEDKETIDLDGRFVDSTYYYKIVSQNIAGNSDFSDVTRAVAGTLLWSFDRQSATCMSVAYSPDGSKVASGWSNYVIIIWDAETGEKKMILDSHEGAVTSIAYSNDRRYFASASYDKTVKVWDARTHDLERNMMGHGEKVNGIAFNNQNNYIASASSDSSIRIWDPGNGSLEREIKVSRRVDCIAWSPDGQYIAAGINLHIKIFNPATGDEITELQGHTGKVKSLDFSPDGGKLASGSQDRSLRTWRVGADWAMLTSVTAHTGAVNTVAYSPNGTYLVSGGNDPDRMIRIESLDGEGEVRKMSGHANTIFDVAFSPDGHYIASGSEDRYIKIWGYFK